MTGWLARSQDSLGTVRELSESTMNWKPASPRKEEEEQQQQTSNTAIQGSVLLGFIAAVSRLLFCIAFSS